MLKKLDIKIVLLVIVTAVVVIVSYIFNSKEKLEESEKYIVTNYSNFYTVDSCLYRFSTYLSEKNIENLWLVLSDNYKENNNINKENVLTIFDEIDEDSTFVSRKMYYENINDNITKYYVYGLIQKNLIYDDAYTEKIEGKDAYYIVYIDSNNKTFSIEPYSGEIFIGDQDGGNNEG